MLLHFLLEETSIEGTNELKITHETIANHLGSHREVITRMLRYFQGEGLVRLSRGKITILDSKRLETLQRFINVFFSKESSIYQNYESHSNKWGIFFILQSNYKNIFIYF